MEEQTQNAEGMDRRGFVKTAATFLIGGTLGFGLGRTFAVSKTPPQTADTSLSSEEVGVLENGRIIEVSEIEIPFNENGQSFGVKGFRYVVDGPYKQHMALWGKPHLKFYPGFRADFIYAKRFDGLDPQEIRARNGVLRSMDYRGDANMDDLLEGMKGILVDLR